MKDGHYSRPVWADDAWLAKYAGKTLEEANVGADGALQACNDLGASLPLPTSSAQNEDLRNFLFNDLAWPKALIGISDLGSRFSKFYESQIVTLRRKLIERKYDCKL